MFFVLMLFSGLYQLLENRRELESLHAEAQINYLKAQINPHFLFNTLNNIYAAATLQHPRTADMVLRLSDLLRYVTYEARAEQVPLHREVAHIRAYIELFQLKSAAPLPIRFDVEGPLEQLQVEPLLLLPLVENAFKHSDLDTNPEGFLNIVLHCSPTALDFQVENSFHADNVQKDAVGGVGLDNIRQRLRLKYGGRHQLTTQVNGSVFVACLQMIPTDSSAPK
jgi:two-component system, LytTR family, sensor kinase